MRATALILGCLLAAAPLSGADYSLFRGDAARSGATAEALVPPARLVWEQDSKGHYYSSPVIVNGIVVLGNVDRYVYAYYLEDGAKKWSSQLGERIYGSSGCVTDGKVYINAVNGCAYALELDSGAVSLTRCVKRLTFFGSTPDILGSSLVQDGRLYVGSDNHEVYAFQLPGGQEIWSYRTGGRVHDTAPAVAGDDLFIASTDGRIYALDKEKGTLKWRSEAYDLLNTTPAVLDGKVYFGSRDHFFRCLDSGTGKLLWSFQTARSVMSSPVVDLASSSVVFGGADGQVYCLGLSDGALKWKYSAGGAVLASPLLTGKTLWIGSFAGDFVALDLMSGKELWSAVVPGGIFSSAAASQGKVVVAGKEGVLYCFQANLDQEPLPVPKKKKKK
ncbi:MAG: PQQ-binding-like beta-propeller repeat protein [candidate division FCPU426 bacterium]